MGFFRDLKEDLSQAVNELIPEEMQKPAKEAEPLKEDFEEEMQPEQDEPVVIDEDLLSRLVDEVLGEEEAEEAQNEDLKRIEERIKAFGKAENDRRRYLAGGQERPGESLTGQAIKTEEPDTEQIPGEQLQEPVTRQIQPERKQLQKQTEEEQVSLQVQTEPTSIQPKEEQKQQELRTEPPPRGEGAEDVPQGKTAAGKSRSAPRTKKGKTTAQRTLFDPEKEKGGMVITGNVSSKGSIEVTGTVIGDVEALGKLDVAGTIRGNARAAEIFAEKAFITGELTADGAVKIGPSSVVIGNIYAGSAVIAGAVRGDLDVKGPLVLDSSAIVLGNIRSKSIQINNGAILEGNFSLCYADVNLEAFFEQYSS